MMKIIIGNWQQLLMVSFGGQFPTPKVFKIEKALAKPLKEKPTCSENQIYYILLPIHNSNKVACNGTLFGTLWYL